MRTLEFEKRLARINAFNTTQEKIKRDRQYIPLVIDRSIDTTSNKWLMYCLAINITNKPTAQQRKSTLETLLSKNKPLYDQVLPVVTEIEALYFN
ncbi:hypothetical protein JX580_04575 [Thiomicrospira microaerophila]|uniref:hypothetical protein n=1 Tax=Thiomicrospira microaerophila TaxID=406020 RepID=UPI00200BDCA8|nr:hypothetical protein [Thiomicrospira microaerophila]UQB43157.1 hypothetical protein JX580_04575 [Thiomicrospira microaerophila]